MWSTIYIIALAQEVLEMGRKGNSSKVTGRLAATAASKTLRDRRTSRASKAAAASALSQTPSRRGKRK